MSPEYLEKMQVQTRRNGFLARGDGLLQFPVKQVTLSVGFGDVHYGSESNETVEVAVINKEGNFVTKQVWQSAFGKKLHDDVAVVDPDEFQALLRYLVMWHDQV